MDLRKIMEFITFLGSLPFFVLIIIVYFFIDKQKSFNLFLSLLAILLLAGGIALVYFKERPKKIKYGNILEKMYASSFPSVHSGRAFILAYFFSVGNNNLLSWILFFFLAALTGYSRIYIKKHYLTDVIFGSLFGIIIAMFIL